MRGRFQSRLRSLYYLWFHSLHEFLSMATQVCWLCSDLVEAKIVTNLFKNNWVSRITFLLDVIVSRDDGLSLYICIKCKLRILSLEKSLANLEAFKQLVRSFFRAYSRPPESFLSVNTTSSHHN